MNTININEIAHKELIGKVLVKLEFADENEELEFADENEECGRRRFYGSVIKDIDLSLDESGEDPVLWLYFDEGHIFSYLNESITVE